ncbi:MAG: type IV secretion system DNA-binding domain-containing protein [Rickettsiaceae bacterium]|nr:type IV secretion system DNA-binding domain-containing protein [Rickettsiaceae bacterium]
MLSKALFTPDSSSSDPFWSSSAEVIFQDIVTYLVDKNHLSLEKLNNMIAKIDIKKLGSKLKNTYSSVYLDPSNEKTAASIRSTLATNTKALRYLPEKGDYPFIFREWVKSISEQNNQDTHNKGPFLFLSASPENRDLMRPLLSMWMDIIASSIMSLGPNSKRRIWMIIDELPALKKIPSLITALSEFRKYGGCIMTGLQSINQLYKIYGQHDAYTMLDQFDTKFIFRTEDHNFANYICKNFGEIEYTESSENISYGANEMRDGVSLSKIERRKLLVTPSDLASLEPCQCYVSLPEPEVRAAKVKMEFV